MESISNLIISNLMISWFDSQNRCMDSNAKDHCDTINQQCGCGYQIEIEIFWFKVMQIQIFNFAINPEVWLCQRHRHFSYSRSCRWLTGVTWLLGFYLHTVFVSGSQWRVIEPSLPAPHVGTFGFLLSHWTINPEVLSTNLVFEILNVGLQVQAEVWDVQERNAQGAQGSVPRRGRRRRRKMLTCFCLADFKPFFC